MPQTISRPPTMRRYHFEGILTLNQRAKGIILAYLTYSCLCKLSQVVTAAAAVEKISFNSPGPCEVLC
jgi:hypothetical protein